MKNSYFKNKINKLLQNLNLVLYPTKLINL